MSFIREFLPRDFTINYSEEFLESNEYFIYSVGYNSHGPVIVKTDLRGEIVLKRRFVVDYDTSNGVLQFHKIIQIIDNGNIHYVVSVSNGTDYFLLKINFRGEVSWIKRVNDILPLNDGTFLVNSKISNEFYFVFSNQNSELGSAYFFPVIVQFRSDGTIKKSLIVHPNGANDYLINTVVSYEFGLTVLGTHKNSFAHVLDLDYELTPKKHKKIFYGEFPFSDFVANDLLVFPIDSDDNAYMVSGYDLISSRAAFLKVSKTYSSKMTFFHDSLNMQATLCKRLDDFYVTTYSTDNNADPRPTRIYKFTPLSLNSLNSSMIWCKKLLDKDNILVKKINTIHNRLTAFNLTGEYLISTDTELNSCKTSILSGATDTESVNVEEIPTDLVNKSMSLSVPEYSFVTNDIEEIFTCEPEKIILVIDDNTSLQSPNLILSAAGSSGSENGGDGSALGVHLRWIFNGTLGQNHLPKGNYSQNNNNFNKPDDFVRVYRAKYEKVETELDFSQPPTLRDNIGRMWMYNIDGKFFYVYFRNTQKYNSIVNTYDESDPLAFFEAYGDELIEVINKRNLFFAATMKFTGNSSGSSVKTEALSVAENLELAPKYTYARKTFTSSFSNALLVCENGRSIRFQTTNCLISKIYFQLYSDFIVNANHEGLWEEVGTFALQTNDTIALTNLEPTPGLIHNKWPRYNDDLFVNINNYIDKWNGATEGYDMNLKELIVKYFELSEAIDNPTAVLQVYPPEELEAGEDAGVSILNVLNLAANDFHFARLLGLGTIDHFNDPTSVQYVYISKYKTLKDINNMAVSKVTTHISMSLPTSTSTIDNRLPQPVKIAEIRGGLFDLSDPECPATVPDEGYTQDGKYRHVTIIAEKTPGLLPNQAFYETTTNYNSKDSTLPVYAGLDYKMDDDADWVKPELSYDPDYSTTVPGDNTLYPETVPLIVDELTDLLYIHKQEKSGIYHYNSYGINIFSRTSRSPVIVDIPTDLKPANLLMPPSNIATVYIRAENPVMFTSTDEQGMLAQFDENDDKTLIRLTYDCHLFHEPATYKIEAKYMGLSDAEIIDADDEIYPDDKEVYADVVKIYFRDYVPEIVSGGGYLINIDNSGIAEIQTTPYYLSSVNQTLTPAVPLSKVSHYVGGIFTVGEKKFIIQDIDVSGQYPIIKVYKKQISDSLTSGEDITDYNNLESPVLNNDSLFTIVENMQNAVSWGTPNPHPLKVTIGSDWDINREVFHEVNYDGETEKFLEKSRGFWKTGTIEIVNEPTEEVDSEGNFILGHRGLYKITFPGFVLGHHSQYSVDPIDKVDWYNGTVRMRTNASFASNGARKTCQVVKLENVGSEQDLVVYFSDLTFDADNEDYDKVHLGSQLINFYPGYKVYLYKNDAFGLNAEAIQPDVDESVRYSIFGLQSHSDNDYQVGGYDSKISVPSILFVQEEIKALPPEATIGALYATRPDFYGKATYTFEVQFNTEQNHKPYAAVFYRTNDEVLLSSLYNHNTLTEIRENLELLGGNDETELGTRWGNFFNFSLIEASNEYNSYSGYKFPLPDKDELIQSIIKFIIWHNENNGNYPDVSIPTSITSFNQLLIPATSGVEADLKFIHFVEQAVQNAFAPLTELPLIYQYIKPSTYVPVPKKQHVRNNSGYLINPLDPTFDMAPMAKIVGTNRISFTDFTLDGTSKNIYFYTAREMNNKMKMSEFGAYSQPVKLVNTAPPAAPEVKRIMPILGDPVLDILPAVQFEINSYHKAEQIKRIHVYRTFDRLNAESVRLMDMVKLIDLAENPIEDDKVWSFHDDFADLEEVPYGETLFYRVTVLREVKYIEYDNGQHLVTEYAPSKPSKISATVIVATLAPDSPVLEFTGELNPETSSMEQVVLHWNKTTYNGTYHLYKMSNQGNWVNIHDITSNDDIIYVDLLDTKWESSTLLLASDSGRIYHHFKVVAENTSGMLSSEENILTIIEGDIAPGIGEMRIDNTFFVRPNI